VALALSLGVRAFDIASALARRPSRRIRRRGVVLYYHAVKPHQRQMFARQMDEMLRRARPFVAGRPEAMKAETPNVAVTFDDGFRSVIENAAPELESRRIPFTLFVPTGSLGQRPAWIRDPKHPSWEETVLSAAELRDLACHPLVALGSHSVTHPNLGELEAGEAAKELAQSRAELQCAAGIEIDSFSFPHGGYTPALIDQAQAAGYRRAFTIEPAIIDGDSDAFTLGRVAADPEDWPLEFRLKIAGAYRWRQYLHLLGRKA
jgi:peptidoglycan/xylan/chitin deacetylase (PgdA/CDA1 family)